MGTTSMIDELWLTLATGSSFPAHRRVSPTHSIELFAQVDSQGRVGLLAISDSCPSTAPAYACVDVGIGKRTDGRWATSVSLKQPALRRMFAAMCNEIAEQGLATDIAIDAAQFVLQHLSRWQRLLALGPDGLLSLEARLGLLGELNLLLAAIEKFGPSEAIDGWHGPHDAPQDFHLPCGYIEVKAVNYGSSEIQISSLEQLDVSGGALLLVVYEFVRCSSGTGGCSLAGTVDSVRSAILGAALAGMRFESLLHEAGYIDRPEYGLEEFRAARVRWVDVGDEFPRWRRSKTPKAITDAKYRLLLAELEQYEARPAIP